MTARLSLDRGHTLRGDKTLDWFFANRKWIRTAKLQVVECGWAERPLPELESSVRFLILAPKRSYKRAHDRNRVKRWLRAAVNQSPVFAELESSLTEQGLQLLIMLRISKPLTTLLWETIMADVSAIGNHLMQRVHLGQQP